MPEFGIVVVARAKNGNLASFITMHHTCFLALVSVLRFNRWVCISLRLNTTFQARDCLNPSLYNKIDVVLAGSRPALSRRWSWRRRQCCFFWRASRRERRRRGDCSRRGSAFDDTGVGCSHRSSSAPRTARFLESCHVLPHPRYF